jgi:16S rRNA (cytidine1402-2'-O)-methyltransferase
MSDQASASSSVPSSNSELGSDTLTRTVLPGPLPAGLVLVSTPIGNLADLTPRAAACLSQADLVLCEDTRVTARLFAAWNISSRMEALHEHNERQRITSLLDLLRQGKRIALVSDAGTPLLSDPGFRLVRAVIGEGLPVSAAPGANAAITALTLSGLPPHPFLFVGFPPPRGAARRAAFSQLRAAERAGLVATLIWHEAPHRLAEALDDLVTVFGATREAAVARELTKRFEEIRRGSLGDLRTHYGHFQIRGEVTVLIGPAEAEETGPDDLDRQLRQALLTHSVKDAAALVAGAANLPKRIVYARALQLADKTI